jgi:glycosyltransferase involved in cell wall biosynthesis
MLIVVDARKWNDSGIGRYLREVVPRVVARSRHDFVLATSRMSSDTASFSGLPTDASLLPDRPLTVSEQWSLSRVNAGRNLLWTPSLATPLLAHRPFVSTVHDVAQLALPPQAIGGRFVRAASLCHLKAIRRRAGLVLFNSEFTRAEFIRFVGHPEGESLVTPLGVGEDFLRVESHPGKLRYIGPAPYFLAIGNIKPHKNLLRLIRAFEAVADRLPHDLVLLGSASNLRTLDGRALAQIQRLSPRVKWISDVDDTRMRHFILGAVALICPSLYEGFGLTPLEGLAMGARVICSDIGAHREVCGPLGCYFDPHSVASIAESLIDAANRSAGDSTFSGRAIAHARTFTWDRTAGLTVDALDSFADRVTAGC